jgi:hypothetical protein
LSKYEDADDGVDEGAVDGNDVSNTASAEYPRGVRTIVTGSNRNQSAPSCAQACTNPRGACTISLVSRGQRRDIGMIVPRRYCKAHRHANAPERAL